MVKFLDDLENASVRKQSPNVGILCLILNIIFPGIGTIINSVVGGDFLVKGLVVGLIQLFTAFLIIGWIWSIWWGFLILKKSK